MFQKHFLVKYFFPCDILTDVNRLAFVNHYARKLFRSIHQQLVSNKDEVRIPSHFARTHQVIFGWALGCLLETRLGNLNLMYCGIVLLSSFVQAFKLYKLVCLYKSWRTNKSRVSAENCTSSNGIPSNPGVCREAFRKQAVS